MERFRRWTFRVRATAKRGASALLARQHARLLALFLLAVSVRVLYVLSTPPESPIGSTDAWGYHRLALNLDRGHGFSLRHQAPFVPDSVRTPLYPAFLLLIRRTLGPSPRTAALVQALLDGITTLLTWRLAVEVHGRGRGIPMPRGPGIPTPHGRGRGIPMPRGRGRGIPMPRGGAHLAAAQRAGRIAALLYALNPTQVRYVNELLAETLLSFLLTLCACLLVQYVASGARSPRGGAARRALLLGALGGLAALCKPNVQFLPLVWLAAMILSRGHDGRISLLVKAQTRHGDAATTGPWDARSKVAPKVEWTRSPGHDRRWRWRDASLVVTAYVAVLLPWMARNTLVFGRLFLSTAFAGNVSRVSAPATWITARGEYAIPWSAEWEAAFSDIVSAAATRYGWAKPWDALSARELDVANRQVYLVARQILCQHPPAWLGSHLQGMLRYLEPQTYRACYARFAGQAWPPDVLDDGLIHALRAIGRGDWAGAGAIVAQERWDKLSPLQRAVWWGTFLGQVGGSILMLRGAWRLRHRPALLAALLGTIGCILWVPGPIAYERFRVPVLSAIVTLIGVSASP